MHCRTIVTLLTGLVVLTGAPVAAQTSLGIAVGASVATGGLNPSQAPALAVSGWIARPLAGPVAWRAEFGREQVGLSDEWADGCSAAGLACDARLTSTSIGGGVQIEPAAGRRVWPYVYVTGGVRSVSARAAVGRLTGSGLASAGWSETAVGVAIGSGLRIRLDGFWEIRAELRYSGYELDAGNIGWVSSLTPGLNLSIRF